MRDVWSWRDHGALAFPETVSGVYQLRGLVLLYHHSKLHPLCQWIQVKQPSHWRANCQVPALPWQNVRDAWILVKVYPKAKLDALNTYGQKQIWQGWRREKLKNKKEAIITGSVTISLKTKLIPRCFKRLQSVCCWAKRSQLERVPQI